MGYLKRLLEYKDAVEELLTTTIPSKTSVPSLPGQSPRGEPRSYAKISEWIGTTPMKLFIIIISNENTNLS